jgi:single-stranded DNA-specific DHH superfamily exonuclease
MELEHKAPSETKDGILIAIPNVKTFNVGILATVLAKRSVAPVVAIGFEAGDRVQFELRISPDSGIDLTAILRKQRAEFAPLTSGGHPMAAGALIWKKDTQRFANSLRNAFVHST